MLEEFRLTIRLGNEEMSASGDVADTLRAIADKIDHRRGGVDLDSLNHAQSILDANGNRVGQYKVISVP